MTKTVECLHQLLTDALSPTALTIEDDSASHAGHAGNTGGGHYNVTIISDQFEGLSLIKRHRLVYDAVDELMVSDIHALSIKAKSPSET